MAVDPIIQQKAEDIRMKIYGEQVRESLASGLEAMSSDVVEVEDRQDTVESQFQQVIDETTGKDIVSAPEILAARNGEPNLKARLDKESQEVSAQLEKNKIQISTEEPMGSDYWYEDRGETPVSFGSGSGVTVQNAELSDSEPSDTQKLWFDEE